LIELTNSSTSSSKQDGNCCDVQKATMNNLFLCGECHCLVPATHWFGHVFFHASIIRLGLTGAGFADSVSEDVAKKQAAKIGFEPWQGQML
jgi:hypothetical protein